jgi:hypothetical protein
VRPDDETRRIPATSAAPADAPTTHLRAPGPLDLAGPTDGEPTGVLPLDELFPSSAADPAQAATPARRGKAGPGLAERLLDDGAAAWDGAIRRAERWLRAGDNALMTVTALAAIVLILVVATFGH